LASKGDIDARLLLATLSGTTLVIASACVVNNYIDRQIDAKMLRTKRRALAAGLITPVYALTYATFLGITGFAVLATWTNWLTFLLGLLAYFVYIVAYGLAKRRSVHGTLVGSIAGALPPVAGYTAVTGSLDLGAGLIFLILVFWQMAHFYSIAIYRLKDYKSAGLPVWPVKKGLRSTKTQIIIYIVSFIVTSTLLACYGYTGLVYLLAMLAVGFMWLYIGIKGFGVKDDELWAHKCFKVSLIVILALAVMMSLGPVLP